MFGLTSYNGNINLAITCCREIVRDPDLLAKCVEDSYNEIVARGKLEQKG